jgi:hypothetical protein
LVKVTPIGRHLDKCMTMDIKNVICHVDFFLAALIFW